MKYAMSLKLLSALAVITVLAAPAFADEKMPATGSGQGAQTSAASQTLLPFPKKWWAED